MKNTKLSIDIKSKEWRDPHCFFDYEKIIKNLDKTILHNREDWHFYAKMGAIGVMLFATFNFAIVQEGPMDVFVNQGTYDQLAYVIMNAISSGLAVGGIGKTVVTLKENHNLQSIKQDITQKYINDHKIDNHSIKEMILQQK